MAGAGCALAVAAFAVALRYRRAHARATEELFRQSELVANLNEGVYRSSLDGRQLSSNPALVRLNGYSTEAEHLAGVKDIATEWYVEPTRRGDFQDILARNGKVEDFISEIYRHKTRERIWITESARLVRDRHTGAPLYYEGSVREITETVQRLQLEERFRKLTSHIPVGLFQFEVDAGGTVRPIFLNPRWEQITGISRKEQMRDVSIFRRGIHPDDISEFATRMAASVRNASSFACDVRFRMPDGQEKWLKISAEPEHDDGKLLYHGYLVDISERKKHEQAITELAYYDPLTRLPNRRQFFRKMLAALRARRRRRDVGVLLFIDLDNFKALNDSQGHEIGDAYLREVGRHLQDLVRPGDTVARMGGDEFVVILDGAGANTEAAVNFATDMAQSMLSAIRAGFTIGNFCHKTSASIGIVPFDRAERQPEEILKRADMAMYRAKSSGRNGIGLFDPGDVELEATRYRLANDFADALARDELELYLQPKIDSGGRILGAEALLRWNHPVNGMIMPDRFIEIAEHFGLAAEMERTVLEKGMAILRGWSVAKATAGYSLALNVSAQSFSNDDFVPLVTRLVEAYGVDPTLLTLELTEHVMAKDQKRVAERMRELKKLGIRLSLDDFGTGYSSLSYLKEMPFDEVKIDGRFVADIETEEDTRALVKAILVMAQSLGLKTVAEHVETHAQEEFLRRLGCDVFQGFLYSPAIPSRRFHQLVAGRQIESMDAGPRRKAKKKAGAKPAFSK